MTIPVLAVGTQIWSPLLVYYGGPEPQILELFEVWGYMIENRKFS